MNTARHVATMIVAVGGLLFGSAVASASSVTTTFPFMSISEDYKSGTDHFYTLDVTDLGDLNSDGVDWVRFTFRNEPFNEPFPIHETLRIGRVYFYDGHLFEANSWIIHNTYVEGTKTGVEFEQEASPEDLPGINNYFKNNDVPALSAVFSADADTSHKQFKGVRAGEFLDIDVALLSGVTYNQVIGDILNKSLIVGIHVQGLGPKGKDSESFIAIPLPAAVWGGLVLMGGIGAARSIRRRTA